MKRLLPLIFLIIINVQANECPPVKPNQRDIVIQPDTAADELVQAFGYNAVNSFQIGHLEKLMLSESAPLLVELTIWKRFTKRVKDVKATKLQQLPYTYYKINNYLLCIPQKWLVKYPDSGFNLATAQPIEKPFSLLPGVLDPLKGFGKTYLMLMDVYRSTVKVLRTLLVHKDSANYSWNVLLFGHGGPMLGAYTDRVAGLPSSEFKKILKFLNTEISTNALFYQTCYAGSKWLLRSYETNGKPNIYNYLIILTGITESPVYSFSNQHPTVFQKFFEKIRTLSICPEQSKELLTLASLLLQAITLEKDGKTYSLRRINNTLQVRWPNTNRFKVVEVDSVISTAKTAKKSDQETVTISSNAFILNTPYLNKSIILGPGPHAIASSINKKNHYIKELIIDEEFDSVDALSRKIFSFFLQVENLSLFSSKVYMIGSVSDKQKKQTLHNVMIVIHGKDAVIPLLKQTQMFYEHNGQEYLMDAKKFTIKKIGQNPKAKISTWFNKEKDKLIAERKK